MNLSCFGGGLPESGCLFFKGREWRGQESAYVISGDNEINFVSYFYNHIIIYSYYTAKFNCTVPGTLNNFSQECNVSSTPSAITAESTVSTSITSTADDKSTMASDADTDTSNHVYIAVGATAGGVCILTFFIITMLLCTILGVRVAKTRRQFTYTANSPHNMQTMDNEQQQEAEHGTLSPYRVVFIWDVFAIIMILC